MKFRTKIGIWFHLTMLLIVAMCALPFVLGVRLGFDNTQIIFAIGSVILLPVCLSIYNTYYVLEETLLRVRCSFFINMLIPYKDIELIYETKDPCGSIALSFDRISINYAKTNGKSNEIYISPRNKQEFLRLLNEKMAEHSQPED